MKKNNNSKSNTHTDDDIGKNGLPKGFDDHETVQVYVKVTRGNDSKHNKTVAVPDGKSTPCYWLGQYNAVSPSEIWIFPDKHKEPWDFRGNVNGLYGYNHGMHDTLWFLPPKISPPASFMTIGRWTFPVQKRDLSSIKPDSPSQFLKVGGRVKKVENLDVSGQWRMLCHKTEPMIVFVRTPKGEKLEFAVQPSNTIDQIKDMVEEELKNSNNQLKTKPVPKKEIRLKFHDKPLKDPTKTLRGCGIKNKDVLDMEPTLVHVKDELTKQTHTFTIDLDNPLKSLKKQIENTLGTPVEHQRLFFHKQKDDDPLKDSPTFRDYGIQHLDTLILKPMQIHVKTPQGKTVTLNVQPNDTIQDVKEKVENKENIPVDDQRLTFKGKELKKPKSTLNDNGIRHGDTLNLEPMIIHVRTPDGKKTITLENVHPDDKIRDIKKRVRDESGIPVEDQRLLFKNKPLKDPNSTLRDHGIVHNDTLDLEGMHIFIKEDWSDKQFKLYVEPADTIDSVKDQIQEKEGHDKKNQFLLFNGTLLEDKPTLRDYGIKHKNVLILERMKIFVKDYNGKTFSLDVHPSDTIDDVKQQIEDLEGHPKDEQKLFFHKTLLDDPSKTLEDNNIKHKDTLELKKKEKEIPVVSPKPQKAAVTPASSPKGPEHNIGLSPWFDPFSSPGGYSPKKKIDRDGVRAKGKKILKGRYHADLETNIKELGDMAAERHKLKKLDEKEMKSLAASRQAK